MDLVLTVMLSMLFYDAVKLILRTFLRFLIFHFPKFKKWIYE